MKLQICRPNYLRRGGQEGSDERQFLHDGADNARILATPDTGHTCHVTLETRVIPLVNGHSPTHCYPGQ